MGVGGGGGNAVVRMTQQSIPGVEFWCLNTDAQVSERALAPLTLHASRRFAAPACEGHRGRCFLLFAGGSAGVEGGGAGGGVERGVYSCPCMTMTVVV